MNIMIVMYCFAYVTCPRIYIPTTLSFVPHVYIITLLCIEKRHLILIIHSIKPFLYSVGAIQLLQWRHNYSLAFNEQSITNSQLDLLDLSRFV